MFLVVIDELSGRVIVVLLAVSFCILVVKDIAKSVWQFDVLSILLGTLVVLIAASVTFPNALSDKDANVVWCASSIHPGDDKLLPSQLLSAI